MTDKMKCLTLSLSFVQVHGFSAAEKIAFVTADKRLATYFPSVPFISLVTQSQNVFNLK